MEKPSFTYEKVTHMISDFHIYPKVQKVSAQINGSKRRKRKGGGGKSKFELRQNWKIRLLISTFHKRKKRKGGSGKLRFNFEKY